MVMLITTGNRKTLPYLIYLRNDKENLPGNSGEEMTLSVLALLVMPVFLKRKRIKMPISNYFQFRRHRYPPILI